MKLKYILNSLLIAAALVFAGCAADHGSGHAAGHISGGGHAGGSVSGSQ